MTISYNWLTEFISTEATPEAVAAMLTSAGLEVESISKYETVKGSLEGVVIGTVLTCSRHPNADKLSVTTVSVGQDRPFAIVCGAPNVAAGQRVAVALPGTTIHPSTGDPITLKATKIRGEVSEGMICAEDELGLGNSHAGIMVLDTTLPDGSPAASYFKLSSDHVFEIGLTPNRADAASHMGVARDLRAILNRPLNLPDVSSFSFPEGAAPPLVSVENTEGCIRYSGVSLTGIQVGESPDWLKDRLKAIGLSPINNVVDITNYACHELGQPLHAFDQQKIRGGAVIVTCLPGGTRFTTLDGKERELKERDLMICDAEGGMCIAGVFGGLNSGISASTTTVFLESACFSPAYIRKTSQVHQLVTDASFRFARGTDPNLTIFALKRAAGLITAICGGSVSSDIVDIYPEPVQNRVFRVRDARINQLIGVSLTRDITFPILENLDISISDPDQEGYTVSVPPYRVDVVQEADIAEEILRIYGFNSIPLSEHVGAEYLADFPAKDYDKFKRTLGETLAGGGFHEILTNSLSNEQYNSRHQFAFAGGEQIAILNKLSEEQGALRQTLLFTGLEVAAHNINRKETDLKLFEFGKIHWRTSQAGEAVERYHEAEKLGLYLTGGSGPESWQDKLRAVSFHDLAQEVSNLLMKCNATGFKQEILNHPCLEYGVQLSRGPQIAGWMGKVNTTVAREFGIRQPVFFAELDAAVLFQSANPKFTIRETPRFPKVRRDLSLVLDRSVTFAQIREIISQTEKKMVKDVMVFDVYEGKNIPEGKKAYAIGLTLLDEEKTLTDAEIDKVMDRLIHSFEQKLGAIIRK
ncbi:MAG: phenylalanine--tRNA ligase subunit beta [Bacteroidota bacterium]